MYYQIEITDPHLKEALDKINAALNSPQPLLTSWGETLLNNNQDRHKMQVNPDGTPWAPLAASTVAQKKDRRMLVQHGDLLRFNYQVSGHSVQVGTTDWKAVFFQYGTKPYVIRPKTKKALYWGNGFYKSVNHPGMPARQIVGFPNSDSQAITDLTFEHLKQVLKGR